MLLDFAGDAEIQALQQHLRQLQGDQEVQRDAHDIALQAEVEARQAAEANAAGLQTQLTQLKDDLAELKQDFAETVRD